MSDDNQLVVPDNFGVMAKGFGVSPVDPTTFTAGIGMSWPTLTLKGKVWGWRFRGESRTYDAPNAAAGGAIMPVQFLDVVIVAAANRISKVYYKEGFKENERPPPTCWSADGITPDQGASEKQAATCRGCPHNVMNARMGDGGVVVKGKDCSDNKRLAVVTLADLDNTDFGGPFMLRLPPGSFQHYTTFCSVMAARGFQPYGVVARLMFDPKVSHPKVMFIPVRAVTEEECVKILAHQNNPRTSEMLNDKAVGAFADPELDGETGAGAVDLPTAPTPGVKPDLVVVKQEPKPEPERKVTTYVAEPMKLKPDALEILAAEKNKIADLEARLAAAEKAAADAADKAVEEKPAPPPLTPEQMRIKELEAKLAEAEAKKKPGRPRSKPVAPPDGTTTAVVTAPSNGTDEPTPTPVGNAISDRIAGLVSKNQ